MSWDMCAATCRPLRSLLLHGFRHCLQISSSCRAYGSFSTSFSQKSNDTLVTIFLPAAVLLWPYSQVADISQYGEPIEVAKLLLPRGATLLGTDVLLEQLPARETPVGPVEVPPKKYYRYGR